MARQYYKDSITGQMKPLGVKVEDTLPVGTIVEYNGQDIPEGWVDIGNGKIEKQYQVIPTNAKLENGDSTSSTNGYTADYINNHSVVVNPTEPSGSARKKVWLQHSNNFFPATDITVNQVGTSYSINVKPNTEYTLSYTKTRISGVTIGNQIVYDFQLIRYFNSSGTQISQETSTLYTLASGGELNINKTLTTPANTAYVTINLGNNNGDNNNNTLVSNIMLNEGSTSLPYEPYVDDKEYILNDNDVYEKFKPQNEVYSTAEVRIGTWIDGKPLYRKVVYIDSLPNNTTVDYNTGITNSETLISLKGIALNCFIMPNANQGIGMWATSINSLSRIRIQTNEDRSSWDAYIFIEYTKTTD